MIRHDIRRHYAIIGALALAGPATRAELGRALHRHWRQLLLDDLIHLEHVQQAVVSTPGQHHLVYSVPSGRQTPRAFMPGMNRRCYAICGALHQHGAVPPSSIEGILHRAAGSMYAELAYLEAKRLIVGDWAPRNGGENRTDPQRRLYRIAVGARVGGVS